MPFNFRSKRGGESPPTIATDENADINSRSKLNTIDVRPQYLDTRETGFSSGGNAGSLQTQVESLASQLHLVLDKQDALE